jgi:Tfp pilus assembly protein PilO
MTHKDPHQVLQTMNRGLHGAGVTVLIAIVATAVWCVVLPLNQEVTQLDKLCDANRAFVSRTAEFKNQHTQLSQQLSQMETRFGELMTRLPSEADESEFLAQLSGLATQSGLVIRDYRPGSVVAREEYNEMEIDLSAKGPYGGICNFLHGLESLPRLCLVTDLTIAGTTEPAEDIYPIDVTLRIYFTPIGEAKTEVSVGRVRNVTGDDWS